MSRLLLMTDSVTVEGTTFVKNQDLVLGYVNGAWPTFGPLTEHYKGTNVKVISCSVFGQVNATTYDCERGDYTPEGAAAVLHWSLHEGFIPTAYGWQGYLDEVAAELRKLKVSPKAVNWFLADYVQVAQVHWVAPKELPVNPITGSKFVGWQFCDSVPTGTGFTYDVSVVDPVWAAQHGWKPAKPHPLLSITSNPTKPAAGPQGRVVELPAGKYLLTGTATKVG